MYEQTQDARPYLEVMKELAAKLQLKEIVDFQGIDLFIHSDFNDVDSLYLITNNNNGDHS